jgi:cation:H+ antiporter
MLHLVLLCGIGFLLLYYGAEWLVKGSSNLARSLGVTPIVIGLTVVAFGTSAPEMVVSVISSIKGKSMIAVGNIFNIALVLGAAALFRPISSQSSVAKRDIPIMLGISFYLLLISMNSRIGRFEGATLFAGIIAYTLMNYFWRRKETQADGRAESDAIACEVEDIGYVGSRGKQIGLVIAGIAGVVGGAELVVDCAVKIMTILGVGEKFIGLTIVAFGTSLPELATSVVAALRKEMDISLGNLVGSNVFNILGVLGITALVRPVPIPGGFFASGLWVDYLVMMATSALPWLMMRKHPRISRANGALLLSCYVAYLCFLIIKA